MRILKWFLIWVLTNLLIHLVLLRATGKIVTLRQEEDGETVASYIIPGINAPPKEVFEAYVPFMAGDIYLIEHSHYGFSPDQLARQVERHAAKHGYTKVNIYAISIGCKVAHELETSTDNSVLLNPCLRPNNLKPGLRTLLQITTPVMMLMRWSLGIIADLPIIPIDHCWRSLAENIEQLFYIAWVPYKTPRNVRGLILSQSDQFLNNRAIIYDLETDSRKSLVGRKESKKLVGDIKNIVLPDIGHADIRNPAYLKAGQELGIFAP